MQEHTLKNGLALITGLMIMLLSWLALTTQTHPLVNKMVIWGEFSQNVEMRTVSRSSSGFEQVSSTIIEATTGRTPRRTGSGSSNFSSHYFELQFSLAEPDRVASDQYPVTVVLHSVELVFPYSNDLFIGNDRIRQFFSSESFFSSQSPVVVINGPDDTAVMAIKRDLGGPVPLTYLLLCAVLGIAVILLIRQASWRSLPAFADLNLGRHISSTAEFDMINGLRGLAALLVLMSHTAPGFYGIQIGLCLLFVLSGFLLSKPFVLDARRIFSWSVLETYFAKRLRRILPMYYAIVFILYLVPLQFDVGLRHLLFIEARGHLWPMTQIFTFYLLLPFVILLTSALYRLNRLFPAVVLMAAIYFWISNLTGWKPYYNGRFFLEFFAYAFLLGVLASYIQYDYLARWDGFQRFVQRYQQSFAVFTMSIMVLTILWVGPVKAPALLVPYVSDFVVKCLLCTLIIVLSLNVRPAWFRAVAANWLLRSVGVIGFSFYLLHGLGMDFVRAFQTQILGLQNLPERSWLFVLCAFLVTWVLAIFTYSYIERPFFGVRRKENR